MARDPVEIGGLVARGIYIRARGILGRFVELRLLKDYEEE